MPRFFLTFFLIITSIILASCGTTDKSKEPLTPLPQIPADPTDRQLHQAVSNYLKLTSAPPQSRYRYSRIDLNNDGLRDALILFESPFSYWCTSSGCIMAVFQAHDENFSIVSEIKNIRGPAMISNETKNEWRDLIARISVKNREDYNVRLSFDGKTYPSDIERSPLAMKSLSEIDGTLIFP